MLQCMLTCKFLSRLRFNHPVNLLFESDHLGPYTIKQGQYFVDGISKPGSYWSIRIAVNGCRVCTVQRVKEAKVNGYLRQQPYSSRY